MASTVFASFSSLGGYSLLPSAIHVFVMDPVCRSLFPFMSLASDLATSFPMGNFLINRSGARTIEVVNF